MFLKGASASIHETTIPKDMLERVLTRDFTAGATDNQRDLAFIVVACRCRRCDQQILWSDQRINMAQKQRRLFGNLRSKLPDMIPVIRSHADDLVPHIERQF